MLRLGLGVSFDKRRIIGRKYDIAALSLFERMTVEPTNLQKLAYSNCIKALKASNNWDWLDGLVVFHSHDEQAALLNWRRDAFNGIKVNTPIWRELDGIETNGSDNGVRFGWNFSNAINASQNSSTLLAYTKALDNQDTYDVGLYSSTPRFTLRSRSEGNAPRFAANGSVVAVSGVTEATLKEGWYGVTRNSSSQITGFFNDASGTASNTSGTPASSFDLVVGGAVYSTSIVNPKSVNCKVIAWGSGITQQQYDDFKSTLNSFFSNFPVEFPTDEINTSLFLDDFPTDSPLTKLAVMGDSLNANALGGAVPEEYDEGDGYRPIRMGYNNLARRMYDKLSTNKATHIRLDAVEWTKSGTWTGFTNTTVFLPSYTNTLYHESIEANAYVEITVPDGTSNFAFICQRDTGYDTLDITLNGGDISAYGVGSVDCERTKDNASDIGNPYYTVEYIGLPAGANTIRISKRNNTLKARVWGGFYWNGNTIVVHNIATGGMTLQKMQQRYFNAMFVENNFDAIIFQVPIMNDVGNNRTDAQSIIDLQNIMDNYIGEVDCLVTTCNPFGINPLDEETNYYTKYSQNLETKSNSIKAHAISEGWAFFDVLQFFKREIISRGGTLEGGEGGLYFTTDGMHPNEDGVDFWWSKIIKFFT